MLHTLTMHGLVNAFLNQPIEVGSIRPKLAGLAAPRRAAAAIESLRLLERRRRHAAARGAPPARGSADRRLIRRTQASDARRPWQIRSEKLRLGASRTLVSANRTRRRGSAPSAPDKAHRKRRHAHELGGHLVVVDLEIVGHVALRALRLPARVRRPCALVRTSTTSPSRHR